MIAVAVYSLLRMVMDDFQKRSVSLDLMILFGVSQFWNAPLKNVYYNGLILIFMCSGIYLYIFLRLKKKNHWDCFGEGDLLFLFCLAPHFQYQLFPLFLVQNLILSGIISIFCHDKTIPLVTTLGIPYLILLLYEEIIPIYPFITHYFNT